MKRILSILLVLAMLLSMIPAVFAANCDITVSTPAPDPVKVGALYQLPLGTVFTDPNGHALSFALKADYGDKVYIKDNTLQFTSAEAGEFRIGITATCTGGGSTEVTVPITVEAVEDGDKNQYGYDETDQASVTVYVTISSDGAPIIGKDDGGTILSHLEVKVPYFPLSLYGLDDFNRYHTENGSGSYTDNEIVQRPTLLHLYIYMLERYYLGVAENVLSVCGDVAGMSEKEVSRHIILGLKDMAGVCPPRFMTEVVTALRKRWPELVLHYHRHMTDGLFVPSVGAAAKAGVQIVDTNLGACVRSYGQGDTLATVAYMEGELGLKTAMNKDMVRDANFVLKQVIPYYDRYCAPYFQGIDNDVTEHAMPGGATSSSQEGALKQGYIHLLPYMLKFLAGTRKIVRYHDVTPGSQITWNTAFLAVTGAYKRGGEEEVKYLLGVLERVNDVPDEAELSEGTRAARLALYQDCNDAFRNLLLGKFGKLPLGFPPDWVYESAFGNAWKQAIADRTTHSPLEKLTDMDIEAERKAFRDIIKREPTEEEMVMYLNHPGDAVKTVQFRAKYGDPNRLPLPVWFEGCSVGEEINFVDTSGKPHQFLLVSMSPANDAGESMVRFVLDSEIFSQLIKVAPPKNGGAGGAVMADPADKYQVGAPSNGDLWVMYVHPGDIVEEGEELFNVSIMKQEKAVLAPVAGIVKRVLKTADYKETRKMETVREGELIVELGPVPRICTNEACSRPLPMNDIEFCPYCGERLSRI